MLSLLLLIILRTYASGEERGKHAPVFEKEKDENKKYWSQRLDK